MSAQILVVDDDFQQRSDLADMVESMGFQVATASDGEDALAKLVSFPANVILTDLVMPRMDGAALLKVLAERGDRTPTIVLTGFGSVDQAISFVHDLKAFWFLEKPVQSEVMRTLLERALQQNQLIEETQRLNRQLSYRGVLDELTGDSPAMKEVFSLIQQVAPTTASVFISGESGTGKELVARAIHRLSPRNGAPFVAVNCAALPDTLVESELFGHEKGAFTGAVERRSGCFEQAHNGTLFLDEIGEMPIGTQAKLLRVIEESRVRRLGGKSDMPFAVRVLAATNRSPEEAIRNNRLREDLYYRLNVFQYLAAASARPQGGYSIDLGRSDPRPEQEARLPRDSSESRRAAAAQSEFVARKCTGTAEHDRARRDYGGRRRNSTEPSSGRFGPGIARRRAVIRFGQRPSDACWGPHGRGGRSIPASDPEVHQRQQDPGGGNSGNFPPHAPQPDQFVRSRENPERRRRLKRASLKVGHRQREKERRPGPRRRFDP